LFAEVAQATVYERVLARDDAARVLSLHFAVVVRLVSIEQDR
jgi:hypothetical protein